MTKENTSRLIFIIEQYNRKTIESEISYKKTLRNDISNVVLQLKAQHQQESVDDGSLNDDRSTCIQTALGSKLIHYVGSATQINPVNSSIPKLIARDVLFDDAQPQMEIYRSENSRLDTFNGSWPHLSRVKPADLAKAGFYFVGKPDRVQCAFCRGILQTWGPRDIPMREHKRSFATCPFILDMDVKNCPIEKRSGDMKEFQEETVFEDRPVHNLITLIDEDFAQTEDPLPSILFIGMSCWEKRWLSLQSSSITDTLNDEQVRRVVDSGFFYSRLHDSGRSTSCALLCFACGFLITPTGDNLENFLNDHEAKTGGCPYLNVRSRIAAAVSNRDTESGGDTSLLSSRLWAAQYHVTKTEIEARLDTDLVRMVMRSRREFSDKRLMRFLIEERLSRHGETFATIEQLLNVAGQAIVEMGGMGVDVENYIMRKREARQRLLQEERLQRMGTASLRMSASLSLSNSNSRNHSDTQQSFRSPECKVCMDQPASIVFTPCGHLCACEDCAARLSDCPICRLPIERTIRTSFQSLPLVTSVPTSRDPIVGNDDLEEDTVNKIYLRRLERGNDSELYLWRLHSFGNCLEDDYFDSPGLGEDFLSTVNVLNSALEDSKAAEVDIIQAVSHNEFQDEVRLDNRGIRNPGAINFHGEKSSGSLTVMIDGWNEIRIE